MRGKSNFVFEFTIPAISTTPRSRMSIVSPIHNHIKLNIPIKIFTEINIFFGIVNCELYSLVSNIDVVLLLLSQKCLKYFRNQEWVKFYFWFGREVGETFQIVNFTNVKVCWRNLNRECSDFILRLSYFFLNTNWLLNNKLKKMLDSFIYLWWFMLITCQEFQPADEHTNRRHHG